MDARTAVPALAALAQESRLRVFRRLVELGHEGACPGEMAEHLDIPAATLSFHLRTLQQAGLVSADRSGRFIHYRADFQAMRDLLDFLSRDCCGGDPSKCFPAAVMPMPTRVRPPRRKF